MRASSPAARRAFESRPSAPIASRAAIARPSSKLRPDGVGGEIVSRDPGRDALDAGDLSDPRPERLGHQIVFDIPSERVEPDFRRVELDRTRRKQRPRVVDEAQGAQRRGLESQTRPEAEGLEKGDGAVEQGDRASSSRSLGGAAADDVEAGLRQAEGRGQPGESRPGDQDVRAASGRLIAVGHRRLSHASFSLDKPADQGDGVAQL